MNNYNWRFKRLRGHLSARMIGIKTRVVILWYGYHPPTHREVQNDIARIEEENARMIELLRDLIYNVTH